MRWIAVTIAVGGLAAGCTTPMGSGTDAGMDAALLPADAGVDTGIRPVDTGIDAPMEVDTGILLVDSGMDAGGIDGGMPVGFAVTGSLATLGGVVSGSTFQILGGRLESIGSSCGGPFCATGSLGP